MDTKQGSEVGLRFRHSHNATGVFFPFGARNRLVLTIVEPSCSHQHATNPNKRSTRFCIARNGCVIGRAAQSRVDSSERSGARRKRQPAPSKDVSINALPRKRNRKSAKRNRRPRHEKDDHSSPTTPTDPIAWQIIGCVGEERLRNTRRT